MPVTRRKAVRMACLGDEAGEARQALLLEHGFQFVRRSGQQHGHGAVGGDPLAGRRAAIVGQNVGALDDEGLALVDLRHLTACMAREPPFQGFGDFGIEDQLAVERLRHGFAGEIVFGGSQAAGENHDARPRQRAAARHRPGGRDRRRSRT